MHIFSVAFQSIAALLAIGVLGFWILRRQNAPENILRVLSTLAIDIGIPAIVFSNIVLNFSPSRVPNWWQLPLWWVAFTTSTLILTVLTSFISTRATRSEFALTMFFPNAIFFPLIVLIGVFGNSNPYTALLFIFVAFQPTLYFSTYHLFFRKKNQDGKGRFKWQRIVNPVLVTTVVAIAIQLAGLASYVPQFVIEIVQLLGNASLPLLMLILGGSLYLDYLKKGKIFVAEIIKFTLVKNLVFPVVFMALLLWVRPAYNIALFILLQAAVPPITGIPIMTEREGGNRSITNQFILASFVFSILSVPAMFNLFNMFFPIPGS
jgi:malate permease and related proteins